MSFDYPSGQGSKSAVWHCPNLHDLTQIPAVGWLWAHFEWFLAILRLLRIGYIFLSLGPAPPLAVVVSGPEEIFPVPPGL